MNKKKKLLLYNWLNSGGGSPAYTLYPSTDFAIRAGVGPAALKGYYSFGGNARDPVSGRLYNCWRKGSNHNSSADGDIMIWFSDDDGVTNTAEYTVKADIALFNLTNPNVMVANNRRVIVFWYEMQVGNISNPKFIYSDDLYNVASPALATWSAEQTFSTDFAGFYLDGPGEGITLANGDLLKPVWTSGIGAQSVRVYGSTAASNGAAWTLKGIVTQDAVNPCDETCIVQLLNGNIMAFIRCNTLNIIRTSVSTDMGATWSALTNTSISNVGKTPVAISPQGYLFGLRRDVATNRTGYFWTSDYTTYNTGFIDGRTAAYMYGGVEWASTRFIVDYAVEAQNSTAFSGPTLIINKYVEQSTTPVAPPTVYDVELQSVFDFSTAAGETQPSTALKTKLQTFYTNLRGASVNLLDQWDFVRPVLNDATLEAIRNRNWKKPWDNNIVSLVAAPTYNGVGYVFNGTTQYVLLSAADRLDQMLKFLQNDCSIWYGTRSSAANDGRVFGNVSTQMIRRLAGDGLFYLRLNSGTYSTVANANLSGRFGGSRVNSATQRGWRNGSQIVSSAAVSAARQSDRLAIGCLNNAGVFQNFSTAEEDYMFIGASIDTKESEFDTILTNYFTDIGLTIS